MSVLHLIRAHPASTVLGVVLALAGVFISLPADGGGKLLAFVGACLLVAALPLAHRGRRARGGAAVLGLAGAALWAVVLTGLGTDVWRLCCRSPDVTVAPTAGTHTTAFTGEGKGFSPNGGVEVTAVKPDGSRYKNLRSMTADEDGELKWEWRWEVGDPDGEWRITFTDLASGKSAAAKLTILGAGPATARPEVKVAPASGGRTTLFNGTAAGFTPAGSVLITAIQPDGRKYPREYHKTPDESGRFPWSWQWDRGDATGVWTIRFEDRSSGLDTETQLTIR